ncbi:IS701 family transposase [Xenorhabdus bovienii]|uniref:IS701 family transposase n=1 Tax=Xenorhabdus bovienii TaxID=40576 RepID=UPI0023B248F9|nr:IS701 family transposase [Xenorhabdus bovienii]MDE9533580.1 IS701 family transposase [Xenorhabdus bovienii]MDE9586399.1 IS701 family transposase [Xenorhabdus bovienii]
MQSPVNLWEQELISLHTRLVPLFHHTGPQQRSLAYLRGLLSDVERKNGWQLAEWIGEKTPDGIQHLLERARWDADAARDILRDYVAEHLGDEQGILIIDETGFIKKGTHSAWVQRQYSGTVGRVENSQIGVFLCYAGNGGHAFIDRALYLPEQWTEDRPRCAAAGIPDSVSFATKPQLARQMLERALDVGVPCHWVTADAVYGRDRTLRCWLGSRHQLFVLAIAQNEQLWWQEPTYVRADVIVDNRPSHCWEKQSAGRGTKGEREYDWAQIPLWRLQSNEEEQCYSHYLLVRRSRNEKQERAYYVVYARKDQADLKTLVQVAGHRWEIESGFEETKGECGLDHYEVRRWPSWYRHITLSLLAHAVLAVLRIQEKKNVGGVGRSQCIGTA